MESRPKLTKRINLSHFKNYYWLKTELIDFCREQGLVATGSKQELEKRVEIFISSGIKTKSLLAKVTGDRDSKQPITCDTPVVNYKNDAATRQFFVGQVGQSFHFNAYLRQFTDRKNLIGKNLTYGDLVEGWLAEEARKDDPNFKSTIGEQFECNRFTRDFFLYEKGKTRADAVKAWEAVKAAPGENTYSFYKVISLGMDEPGETGKNKRV
jgi:hypothetical protein